MRITRAAAVVAGLSMVCLTALPAQGDTYVAVANWEMDELPEAEVMSDSSGNAFDGDVGDEVVTGVVVAEDNAAYRFARVKPNTPPARPEHNVVVPHDHRLNPADRDEYVVEVRLRTTNKFGNVVQKGQAGARGGYWKIQLPLAEPSCLFRGPGGVTNAVRARGKPIDDDNWHTIRCEATPDKVEMFVDGVFIGRNRGLTGRIANDEPVYIGGKGFCDQIKITCDYFGGDIDYVRLEGRDAT